MNLEEYLGALRTCLDESESFDLVHGAYTQHATEHKLTAEFGVYDNYPIFLSAQIEDVVRYLQDSGKYGLEEIRKTEYGERYYFNYAPGTITVEVFKGIPFFSCTGDDAERKRQDEEYCMTIMLHPYQEKKISGISDSNALAKAILDLGKCILENKIPACFPKSRGWKHLEDYSRMVVHTPIDDLTE